MTDDRPSDVPPSSTEPTPTPGVTAAGSTAPGDPSVEEGSQPGRKRWVLAALAALGVALFTIPLLQGPSGPAATGTPSASPSEAASAANGTSSCAENEGRMNFDFTFKDKNGATVRLADYKGKVILLNFWATWCGPCKVEIPEFVEVYDRHRDRGFEIVGVLSQDDPSPQDLTSFTSSYKMQYPVLRANEDFEDAVGPLWALPTTYVIDRTGAICTKHMGPMSKEMVEREIKGLL